MPKIFIIACEASGDKHGADLVQSLKKLDPAIEFEGLGGREMKQAGVSLLEDMTRISALGLGDVLRKYFQFRRVFYRALARVKEWKPDLLVLIDSPAFNLRFAKKIKKKIPVIYYISPQIWAWGWRRIGTIKKTVDHMIVILPFEEEIYRKAGVPCTFIGHPLLDRVKPSKSRQALRQEFRLKESDQAVVILPGSREPEVRRILPIMLESAARLQKEKPELRILLTQAPHVAAEIYDSILQDYPQVQLERFSDRIYDIVYLSDFALVASGTATLETALLGTPYFLLYKASASTFFLGRRLVRIPYIGLVNVLAGRHVVPEFIQHLAQPETISHETKVLLENSDLREKLRREIQEVCQKLGEPGATERAARLIKSILQAS
ncbi:MAG: lipid-A-disaccharide synthase [Candidatus Omnitrophica bacterium]|nr:lipid-A-disaccharide synthase [Candidatus Omnitrophota bacterium]